MIPSTSASPPNSNSDRLLNSGATWQTLLRCWQHLVLTSLSYRALTFLLLTPLLSLMVGWLLSTSGAAALTDLEIAEYALRPLGFFIMLLSTTAWTTLAAWEQSSLLIVMVAQARGETISPLDALRYTLRNALTVYRLMARVLLVTLLWISPWLAAGWMTYELLLTGHDINYHLAERTENLQIAIGIGIVLALIVLWQLLHLISGWFFALPLVLWEGLSPRTALLESRKRLAGRKWKIWKRLSFWVLAVIAFGLLNALILNWMADRLLPREVGNLSLLVMRVILMLVVFSALSLIVRVFSTLGFTVILFDSYRRFCLEVDPTLATGLMRPIPIVSRSHPLSPLRWKLYATCGLLLLLWVSLGQLNSDPSVDHALVMAHRGSSIAAPENSVSAIKQAIVDGADWVEIDVQETSDGEIVVVHDSDLMKLASYSKKIWESTLAELQAVDIGGRWGPAFAGERVPTLREVLQVAHNQVNVLIELKYYGHEKQLEQRVIDIVEQEGMTQQVMFMSLKPSGITKLRQLRPSWKCGILLSVSIGSLEQLDVDFLAINARFATRELIRRIHRSGRDVYVWTVDEPTMISTLMNRDIDGIITNRPEIARQVLSSRAEMSLAERLLTEAAALFRVDRDQVLEEH